MMLGDEVVLEVGAGAVVGAGCHSRQRRPNKRANTCITAEKWYMSNNEADRKSLKKNLQQCLRLKSIQSKENSTFTALFVCKCRSSGSATSSRWRTSGPGSGSGSGSLSLSLSLSFPCLAHSGAAKLRNCEQQCKCRSPPTSTYISSIKLAAFSQNKQKQQTKTSIQSILSQSAILGILLTTPKPTISHPPHTSTMGLVKKLILGGTVYGVAREFSKKRDGEQQGRKSSPEPCPPQHSQQQYYYPPPPPPQQAYYASPPPQHYHQAPPAYEQQQQHLHYQPRQDWDEKR